LVLGSLLAASACELPEVVIPEGDPIVVVHGIMRPDVDRQYIVVERTFTGTIDYQYDIAPIVPTEDGPLVPIEGALVLVENTSVAEDTCGSAVTFLEELSPEYRMPGVYWAPGGCPIMRPGDQLSLTIETDKEEVVTGTARVQGMNAAFMSIAGDTVSFDADTVVDFNRDRDTLRVWVEAEAGRLLQVEVLRYGELDAVVGLDIEPGSKVFADSTGAALPGDLIDIFERADGEDVFRAGRHYLISAALTDTNYFDFARSRSDPFTGRGFINRLEGGIGVFGSLVAASARIKTHGDMDDPREGVYRLEGDLVGVDIDATLSVFLARSVDESELSGFLNGDWFEQGAGPGGTLVWQPSEAHYLDVDGDFAGEDFQAVLYVVSEGALKSEMQKIRLSGTRVPGRPFTTQVEELRGTRALPLGTLTMTQQ
jgi:hypothetical protein